jgi:hypothetical protein
LTEIKRRRKQRRDRKKRNRKTQGKIKDYILLISLLVWLQNKLIYRLKERVKPKYKEINKRLITWWYGLRNGKRSKVWLGCDLWCSAMVTCCRGDIFFMLTVLICRGSLSSNKNFSTHVFYANTYICMCPYK